MFKISFPLPGTPSGKDQSAGFSSLLLLVGLSILAGTFVYSATNRSINMNSMLQTARYQSSRDAIANSIRYTVGIPALLKMSASQDPSSHLLSCLDTTVINHCDAIDVATGNAIDHDLKVFDMQSKQLTGTAANPVYYDPQTGALCGTTYASGCDLQSTATFRISCGAATNCRGVSSAILSIHFRVELKSGATLPNNTTLNPFDLNPDIKIPLSAIQAGAILSSTSPGDPNQPYTPISDPTTESDITIFDPVTGSKTCNDMKALGNPAVVYDDPKLISGAPGTTYTGLTTDLHVADETINDISNITGSVWATAKTLVHASSITAGGIGVDLNAVDIGNLSSITSSHTSIVAHTLSSVSSFTGHLYASADSIGSLSSITTSQYFVLVNRGWVSSGSTGATPVSLSSITSGNFLMCGFSISDLSNVTANFIGIVNGAVPANISSMSVGQLTIYGGSLANLSNSTVTNLTLYNTNVGNISSVTGNIQAYGAATIIHSIDHVTGNIDLYNGATITIPPTNIVGTVTYH